jgi:hypothetical protein
MSAKSPMRYAGINRREEADSTVGSPRGIRPKAKGPFVSRRHLSTSIVAP